MKGFDEEGAASDFAHKRERERRRFYARRPKKLKDVLAQLLSRRGYGRVQSDEALQAAWHQAAGVLGPGVSHACQVRGGQLEVLVANSTARQELGFEQERIVAELKKLLPEAGISRLRFRTGRLPSAGP